MNLPQDKFEVQIKSKAKMLFDGMAFSITSRNENGEFDILNMHGNLIAVVRDFLIINKGQDSEQHIPISSGLIINEKNRLSVYVVS